MRTVKFIKYTFIIITAVLFFVKCDKEIIKDGPVFGNYHYINKTFHEIEMFVYYKNTLLDQQLIHVNDTFVHQSQGFIGTYAFEYWHQFESVLADSIYLTFSDHKYLTFNRNDSILKYGYDEYFLSNDSTCDFYYYFDMSDYDIAALIPSN